MVDSVLAVRDLVTQFNTFDGTVTAVSGVSFDVVKGQVLGIVGESGCGKSVTALSVMRLIDQTNGKIASGSVLLDGKEDLLKLSQDEMRKIRGNQISMIFQEPMTSLNPLFTIGNQLGEALSLHLGLKGQKNRDYCIELLKKVQIPRADKIIDEYPHQLSGGMRQRVMIAMALSCNPKLLIADEPTTALDVTIQAQVLELMKDLIRDHSMAVMFITHDLGVIAEMADSVLVMYGGKVVEEASTQVLFEKPLHPYTLGLLNSRPAFVEKGAQLSCIPGMVPSLNQMPPGCAFAPRCEFATEECKKRMPELAHKGPGHKVRCILR